MPAALLKFMGYIISVRTHAVTITAKILMLKLQTKRIGLAARCRCTMMSDGKDILTDTEWNLRNLRYAVLNKVLSHVWIYCQMRFCRNIFFWQNLNSQPNAVYPKLTKNPK